LQEIFPKDKINRIGCKDATGRRIRKRGGNPALFEYALKQLEEAPSHVLAFGNELCDAQAAANAGIKAYHCLWGADVKEKEQMLADSEHQCITSPLQIIDILRSEHTSQS
jgi:phosphoglycolate phosphatase